MIVTKKAIPRRTILRGLGTALALPLLDAMVPALGAVTTTAGKPVRRFGVIYHPNGIVIEKFRPTGVGTNFEFSPILKGVEKYKDQLLILSKMAHRQAEANGDGSGDHARGSGGYLTGVHVKKTEGNVFGGISIDQMMGKAFENETQLSTLELALDANGQPQIANADSYGALRNYVGLLDAVRQVGHLLGYGPLGGPAGDSGGDD